VKFVQRRVIRRLVELDGAGVTNVLGDEALKHSFSKPNCGVDWKLEAKQLIGELAVPALDLHANGRKLMGNTLMTSTW
jgi:hypothetical protein